MKREKGNRREWIKMLNIAICDDDIQITGTIENLVRKIANKNFVEVETEVFWNGQGLLDAIIKDSKFDIIYLDIEMPKEDGISVAKRIRTYDKNVLIIYVTSHENHIDFSLDIKIPMKMEFKGADICLILGNLLENAVEAAERVRKKKYIKIQMKYDKGNLLIFLMNSYQGRLIKMKDERLKSTKSDAGNHGVGLPSVYRAAAKYNGTVTVDDSIPERFLVRVVLYGEKE